MSAPALVAVLFGGPSPEHDVSVLTGLQAARALAQHPLGPAPRALYWSKGGDWFEVAADLEATSFADGPPDGARLVQLTVGGGGGFTTGTSRLRARSSTRL